MTSIEKILRFLLNSQVVKFVIESSSVKHGEKLLSTILDALSDTTDSLLASVKNMYTKSEVDDAVKGAGKVKSVSVNDGEPAEPDENGNVNIEVEGGQGDDGVSPHIDPVTGHWFIGETDTNVNARGPQGNSGVASGDEVVVVNNLDGEPSDLEQGQVAVLSAEMGKELSLGILAGKGTFGDAFDKSKEDNVVFPWLLSDVTSRGDSITKMIWHVGNGTFIDAIGSEIDGQRNGVTIKSNGSGTINYRGRNNSSAPYAALSFGKGVTNFSFSEIAEAVKSADSSIDSTYDGSTFSDVTFDFDSADTVIDIDFGGQSFIGNQVTGVGNNYLLYADSGAMNRLTAIRRLDISSSGFASIHGARNSNTDTVLEYIQLSGEFVNNTFSLCKFNTAIRVFDLKDVDISNITSLNGYFGADSDWGTITVDIRTWDTSDIENFSGFMLRRKNVTIIIGNFSTESASTTTNFFNLTSGVTVVCTSDTPPDLSYDWIDGHVGAIKIPNKTVEVNGESVSVLSIYQNHVQNAGDTVGSSGWSKYASIMTTYEEGEY